MNRPWQRARHTAPRLLCSLMLLQLAGQALAASPGSTQQVLREGDIAPGVNGQATFTDIHRLRFSSDGRSLSYFASLEGAGIDASNRDGIWLGDQLLARSGDKAPGADGALFSQLNLHVDSLAYTAFLTGAGMNNSSNNQGLWQGQQLVARTGRAAPDGSGRLFTGLSVVQSKYSKGQALYSASLSDGSRSLWLGTRLLAQDKMAAPGLAGLSFTALGATSQGPSGLVAYTATLSGTGVTTGNDESVWSDQRLLMREGEVLEGFTVGSFSNSTLTVGSQGELAFVNTSKNAAGTSRLTLWQNRTLVAQAGEQVQVNGETLSRSPTQTFAFSPQGEVVYEASLLAPQGGGSSRSLWRGQTLIAYSGQSLASAGLSGLVAAGISFVDMAAGGQMAWSAFVRGPGSVANDEALILGDGRDMLIAARTGDVLSDGRSITRLDAGSARMNEQGQLAYTADTLKGAVLLLYTPALRWRSDSGGSWDDASHWTLGLRPGDVHDVTLDSSGAVQVNGPSGAVALKSLQVGTGSGLVTLHMAGGSIGAADPIVIGPRGVLSGSGSFSRLVINQGTVQAERLVMSESLSNAGLVRGVAGGPRQGAGLQAELLNQASGRVLVQPGETLQLRGASHRNLGVFEINQGRLEVGGSLLNGSGGLIDLNGATALASGAWSNAAGARILLGNARLTVSAGLSNAGQLLVTSGDSDVFGPLRNQQGGQIILSGQGSTTFYDAVELQAGSELRTSAGATAVFFGAVAQRSGALLSGTGHKYFEGGFGVGNSPGLGEDGGDVSFGSANTYLAEIGGSELGSSYDHYRVAGTLTLGGTLKLVSFAGFSGQAGQSFDLFDWGTLQGQFSSIDSSGLLLATGTQLDLSRLYIDGVIGVTAVPEPSQWALMLLGGMSLLAWRRRPTRQP